MESHRPSVKLSKLVVSLEFVYGIGYNANLIQLEIHNDANMRFLTNLHI